MNTDEINKITENFIGCAYTVSNVLGAGFLEKVYENALTYEMRKNGLRVEQQKSITVKYDCIIVGDYVDDMIVNDVVIVELKACSAIDNIHKAQLLNYLKATDIRTGLLLNFRTPKLQIKRMVI